VARAWHAGAPSDSSEHLRSDDVYFRRAGVQEVSGAPLDASVDSGQPVGNEGSEA
jgi:hypothetical protein